MKTDDAIRDTVREQYGQIAETHDETGASCCGPECCAEETTGVSETLGYTAEELARLPEGADLGLGSGNPVAAADIHPGETVLDLGSGGGIDCFLAAHAVGPEGRVIGVDMTPEMLERARRALASTDFRNVEFRLGEIEALPVADETVDVILSNCVINLSPDRGRVLAEAFRVLKPGGRLVISDLVSEEDTPDELRKCAEEACSCLPVPRGEYLRDLEAAGFTGGTIDPEKEYPSDSLKARRAADQVIEEDPELEETVEGFVRSVRGAIIEARKPASCC